jgi:S1-C subfamily serine protease
VNDLDFLIVALVVIAALGGHRLGFLGRATSWIGLAVGFYIALRLLPQVLNRLHSSAPATLAAVAVAMMAAGALIGQGIGLAIGSRLHQALPPGPIRRVDRVIGGVAGAVGVLIVLWLLIPSIATVPGWPARAVAGSAISRWESSSLPPPPDAVQVLRRVIGDEAPQVFAVLGPGVAAGDPPSTSPFPALQTKELIDSTVKVEGQACGSIYEGSGFAVATDLIVTNAHVIAGEKPSDTDVRLPRGTTLPATVVMFDPRRDLALLSVPGLGETPLPIASPHTGLTGAVFGHPEGADLTAVSPARIAIEERAVGLDIYDSHNVSRDILVLAAALAHGDSGGALIDASGQVVGVAFAIAADNPNTAYALSSSELTAALREPRVQSGVSTGPCLAS